ncbi:MAG: hypothetical protein ACJ8F7_05180 [Gemmataceae bacterium]
MLKAALCSCGLLGLLLLAELPAARADVVYLKDGTVLHGKVLVKREEVEGIPVPIGNFFAVSDGVRFIVFSTRNLDPGRPPENTDIRGDFIRLERDYPKSPHGPPPGGEFRGTTPYNERGERTLNMMTPMGAQPIRQRVTFMSPYHTRLDAIEFSWASHYLTAEMDPAIVKRLVMQFDKVKETPGKPDVDKRMTRFRFYLQLKWFEQAEQELDDLIAVMPDARDRAEKGRAELRQTLAEVLVGESEASLKAGQLRLAMAYLQKIPPAAQNGPANIQINAMRVKLTNIAKQMNDAKRYLTLLPDDAEGAAAEVLCEAAATIRDELYVEGLDRLEPFLTLAEQAERNAKQGREPAQPPEKLLALAVTGWLLGKESADTKPEVARKLWKARSYAQAYVNIGSLSGRNKLTKGYQADEPVKLEELARIISLLPPPEPEEKIVDEPVKRKTGTAIGSRRPIEYWVQTPLDYKHGRPSPTLILLHHKGDRPENFMARYSFMAKRYGYLLVSVDWTDGLEGTYGYTTEEQLRVLDAIRDVKQHYHVDSDRVFLHGWGEGGNAAFDIGLSNPDLFAGVIPMSSQPKLTATVPLWPNALNLPFYIITGDLAGDAPKGILRVNQEWTQRGFPSLCVFYRGRGVEWFGGELPFIFDWMSRQKRANPFPDLGRTPDIEGSYHVMRTANNHCYWLSADSLDPRCIYDPETKRAAQPACLRASIKAGNDVRLFASGTTKVTMSFGPGMIDFGKAVRVQYTVRGGDRSWNSKVPLRPELSVMMEDLYERFDQRRPVLVKLTLP